MVAVAGLYVADGPAHRQLLPGPSVSRGRLPVHLPGLHDCRIDLAVHHQPPPAGVLVEIEADLERTHPKPTGMGPIDEGEPTPDDVGADFDDPQSWHSLELAMMTESKVPKAS